MNGQTSQERRRRTPARGQGGLTLRGVGQGLGDQTQDVGGRPHRSLSLFPNFCKQDCCGLARVTHTPLTACSLGLLHLPPWRLGSNLGGGGGGGRGAAELGAATLAGTREPAPFSRPSSRNGDEGSSVQWPQWVWETHVPLLPSEAIHNAPLFSG